MAQRLFSAADDQRILDLRENHKQAWSDIARALGRSSGWCISFRYHRVLRPPAAPAPNREARDRPCMRCRTVFASPHNGVRHCDSCRAGMSCSITEARGSLGWRAGSPHIDDSSYA